MSTRPAAHEIPDSPCMAKAQFAILFGERFTRAMA
jgi:hypothetical protein